MPKSDDEISGRWLDLELAGMQGPLASQGPLAGAPLDPPKLDRADDS